MGAHSYTITYRLESRTDVHEAWQRQVEEDRYESGSGSYAGNATTMNGSIIWRNYLLSSEDDAIEKVLDLHEKWSGPIACSFYLPSEHSVSQKKKIEKIEASFEVATNRKFVYMQKVVQNFLSRKTAFVGCKGCGSKLSMKHMEEEVRRNGLLSRTYYSYMYPKLPKCPLCKHSLASQTHVDRIETLSGAIEKINDDLIEASKPPVSKKVGWVVGGWAAC